MFVLALILLIFSDGVLSVRKPCDGTKCNGDRNAVYKQCPNPCPLTCAKPNPKPCAKMCLEFGCECAAGYVLTEIGGSCVKPSQCPEPTCSNNERYVTDDNSCQKTCANRLAPWELMGACLPYTGCSCLPGYVRQFSNGTGSCIPEKECPRDENCNGDVHTVYKVCPNPCPLTCANPEPRVCSRMCIRIGCECAEGYVLSEIGGRCILPENCQGSPQCADPNASPQNCPRSCQPTCAQPDTDTLICTDECLQSGCVCNSGYILDVDGGTCIPISQCPTDGSCNGDLNATITECTSPCPVSCSDPEGSRPCITLCLPTGCMCKPGFVQSEEGCIDPADCTVNSQCDDPNASPQDCPSSCQPICARPNADTMLCTDDCLQSGCVCNSGYILDERGGQCIPISDCPDDLSCNGDQNATIAECPNPCPATCAEPDTSNKPCLAICLPTSCDCKPGFVLNEDGECILFEDCPGPDGCGGDPNAMPDDCPSYCEPTCDQPDTPMPCVPACDPRGCKCKPGFLLSERDGQCIKPEQCPVPICAARNEEYVIDYVGSIKTCGNRLLGPYQRDPPGPYTGCKCVDGCVRKYDNATGPCIPAKKCPPIPKKCGRNEVRTSCRIQCPPQSCESIYTSYLCLPAECEPGCNCKNGYLRDPNGVCIPSEQCPPSSQCADPNASPQECPRSCQPTCAQPDTDTLICNDECLQSGCVCNPGYILDVIGGTCIPISECPADGSCNGDLNATITECTSPCPVSCSDPEGSRPCITLCLPTGCACKPGFVQSEGGCIDPADCPGNSQCDDPNASPQDCPSSCQPTCARPNADTMLCTDDCLQSGCVCNSEYILDERDGQCIPIADCPDDQSCNGDQNATIAECPNPCPATCAEPDTSNKPCPAICLPTGCDCKPGFVLNEDGECILFEDCSVPICVARNEEYVIDYVGPIKTCGNRLIGPYQRDPPGPYTGCKCVDGCVRQYDNATGPCIPAKKCPPIPKKCGRNEVRTSCRFQCPPQSCESIYTSYLCLPAECEPGCNCKNGYLRDANNVCIPNEQCPPFSSCIDPNAISEDCPSSCQPTCAQPDTDDIICIAECLPSGCVCKPGYILDETDGTCIPESECPNISECSDPNASPEPCPRSCQPTCEQPDTSRLFCTANCLPSGCVCNMGYILDEYNGECIQIDDCPDDESCNGDQNATIAQCPNPCPATCAEPDTSNKPCLSICLPVGCDCKDGYVLSEIGGSCIKLEDCPVSGCGCNDPCECALESPPLPQPPSPWDEIEISFYVEPPIELPSCDCLLSENNVCDGINCYPVCNCNDSGTQECSDPNASPQDCPRSCQPTCAQPDTSRLICTDNCLPSGCVCNPGYILDEVDGECIEISNCPGTQECSDPNASPQDCPRSCQPTCAQPDTSQVICTENCLPSGCVCNPGYILDEVDGECIEISDCPDTQECSDPNASPQDCPRSCQPTCAQPDTSQLICTTNCLPSGCVCNPGYILDEVDGECIKISECPDNQSCNGDANATITECPISCPNTCGYPTSSKRPCGEVCLPTGCKCKSGYLSTEYVGGICIKPEDCPVDESCNGDRNATSSPCPSSCPPTCALRDTSNIDCISMCDPSGCFCKPGFILTDRGGLCIRPEDCPPMGCKGDPNAEPNECPSSCPPTCGQPDRSGRPCNFMCDPSGCVCKEGYVLTKKGGKCVLPKQCPGGEPRCPGNKTFVSCYVGCPTNYCPVDDGRYEIACDAPFPCPPGCSCKNGYLMLSNEDPRCILSSECPPVACTRPNEVWDPSPLNCEDERCEDINALCFDWTPGPPKCVCEPGYYRNQSDICVLASECPQSCNVPENCRRTCASPNVPCRYEPSDFNIDGCECMDGFILSEIGGPCIRIEDCPKEISCSGDPHARPVKCPQPCPSTCDAPNATPCKRMCDPIGCECEIGYILSNLTGLCILPDKCPGGNPCGVNEDFRQCKYECPRDYCPVDDNSDKIACDPFPFCLSGCACQLNHRRLSLEDPTCIVSSDCPPVECTRPNEIWSGCPSECFSGYCNDIEYENVTCNTLVLNCQPKCICKPGTYRNENDICVPASECPPFCPIPNECQRTCASPNPIGCSYEPPRTNMDGCQCMDGYILSEIGGQCIRIEDCPDEVACNGDPNARPKQCPAPCPSTCGSPNAVPCRRRCDPIGCECKPGYILDEEEGRCMIPDDCPGGDPCGPNGFFTSCAMDCPLDYCPVDDSRSIVVCDPSPNCLSGCVCRLNHRWLSTENRTCIVSSDCPPVQCTRPNEKWSSCPTACLAESCDDYVYPPRPCFPLVLNCQPQCICKKKHCRNEQDICVPATSC